MKSYCIVNIGVSGSYKNLTGVRIDKRYKDVRMSDVRKIVNETYPERPMVMGWVDVTGLN